MNRSSTLRYFQVVQATLLALLCAFVPTVGATSATNSPEAAGPVLGNVVLSATSVDVTNTAHTIRVDAQIIDQDSGIKSALIILQHEGSSKDTKGYGDLVSGTDKNGVWRIDLTLPRYARTGTWRVEIITRDNENRSERLFSDASLLVTGTSDLAAPELVGSPSFEPPSVSVSGGAQNVQATVQVRDDLSGVRHVAFKITKDGETIYGSGSQLVAGDNLLGTWRSTFYIPASTPDGDWMLTATLYDQLDNTAVLDTDAKLHIGGGDSQPPVLAGQASLDPSSITLSGGANTVVLTVPVRDDVAGVKRVYGIFSKGDASFLSNWATLVSGTVLDGVWTAETHVPDNTAAGVWQIELYLLDHADNYAYAASNLTLTVTESDSHAPTLSGPATVTPATVDLSSGSQWVNVSLPVQDNASGTRLVRVRLAQSENASHVAQADAALVAGTTTSGTWQASLRLTPNFAPGSYRLFVEATDEAENTATLKPEQGLHVTLQQPGAVDFPSPLDGDAGIALRPDLGWRPVIGAARYDLYLWPASGNQPSQPTVKDLLTANFRPMAPLAEGEYRWRVVARNGAGESTGPVWAFETGGAPDLVVSGVQVQSNPVMGEEVEVRWVVTNKGKSGTVVPAWKDVVFLTTANEASRTRLGTFQNVSFLNAGESYANVQTVRLPERHSGPMQITVWTDYYKDQPESDVTNNFTHAPVEIGLPPVADLQVASLLVPDQAFSGQPVNVRWTVQNRGSASTLARRWNDVVYVASSPELDPKTAIFRTRIPTEGPLERDSTYTRDAVVVLPADSWGKFYVFVVLDELDVVFESAGEANNVEVQAIDVTLSPPPDLYVATTEVLGDAASGQPVSVRWTVENRGAGVTLSAWQDRLYLSPSPTFDHATATVLATFSQSTPIAPDGSESRTENVRIPNGISGAHYLFVQTDWRDEVFEGPYEDNNLGGGTPVQVTLSPWPDLRVSSVDVSGIPKAGESIAVTWRVENGGSALAVAPWQDSVYVSTSPTWSRSGARLLEFVERTAPLAVGATYTASTQVRLPADLSGTVHLFVHADAGEVIYEHTDEGNNLGMRTIEVAPYPGADLEVVALSAPSSGSSGEAIQVQWTVENRGQGPTLAGGWEDVVFLSRDEVLNEAQDLRLASASRTGALAPGASYVRSLSVRLPDGASGGYRLLVRTDHLGQVEDLQPANNTKASGEVQIQGTPPADLRISQVRVPPGIVAGQPAVFSWTVTNAGQGPTPDTTWVDRVYLSRNAEVDRGDLLLGTVSRSGRLQPGSSYEQQLEAVIPLYSSGSQYLIVWTDAGNAVYEGDGEGDNLYHFPIPVTLPPPVDLTVTDVQISPTSVAGEEVAVSWTMHNVGSHPATGYISIGVFFSKDAVWDDGDPLLGVVDRHRVDLAPGASKTLHTQVDAASMLQIDAAGDLVGRMPGVTPGAYHAIVRLDLFNNLRESDKTNNTGVSVGTTQVDVPVLPLGTPLAGAWASAREDRLYRLDVGAGLDLRLTLESEQPYGSGLYVAFDRAASGSDFDFAATTVSETSRSLVVPSTRAGRYYVLVRGDQTPRQYTLRAEALQFGLASVQPHRVGQGVVTTRLHGAGFRSDTRVFLQDATGDVIEAEVVDVPSTVEMIVRWDLSKVSLGTYAVSVRRSDGAQIEKAQALEVEPTRPFELAVVRNVPSDIRVTVPTLYTWVFRNVSNIDIPYATLLWAVSTDTEAKVDAKEGLLTRSVLKARAEQEETDYFDTASARFIPVIARDVPVDGLLDVRLTLTAPELRLGDLRDFPLNLTWHLQGKQAFISDHLGKVEAGRTAILARAEQVAPGLVAMAQERTGFARNALEGLVQLGLLDHDDLDGALSIAASTSFAEVSPFSTPLSSDPSLAAGKSGGAENAPSCEDFYDGMGCVAGVIDCFVDIPLIPLTVGMSTALCAAGVSSCFGPVGPVGCIGLASAATCFMKEFTCGNKAGSRDPNDILGPEGFGDERWVSVNTPLSYTIRFENDPELATAPAQTVRIQLPLDVTLDPRTFRMGAFGFGPYSFDVPEGTAYYTTRLDLRDSLGIYVDVQAGVDVTTAQAFWTLRSVEPSTGGEPTDPFAGFLPVNDSLGRGEGFVNFTIRPLREARTGDIARAEATIVFDLNEPISTPPIFNTIDAAPPSCRILPLVDAADPTQVKLTFDGQDDVGGSGIRDYALYVSKDSGPYQLHRSGIIDANYVFAGEEGGNYRFFVVSTDNTGNMEPIKKWGDVAVDVEEETGSEVPGTFGLHQNYPNPFNPVTTVPFDLPQAGQVHLNLYDVLGRRVGQMDLGTLQAGAYGQLLDLSHLASGVYFYELRVRDGSKVQFRDVKSLVLVK